MILCWLRFCLVVVRYVIGVKHGGLLWVVICLVAYLLLVCVVDYLG